MCDSAPFAVIMTFSKYDLSFISVILISNHRTSTNKFCALNWGLLQFLGVVESKRYFNLKHVTYYQGQIYKKGTDQQSISNNRAWLILALFLELKIIAKRFNNFKIRFFHFLTALPKSEMWRIIKTAAWNCPW